MRVIDRVGNELRDGDTVYWLMPNGQQILAHLKTVVEPGLINDKDGNKSNGKLIIEIEMGMPYDPNSKVQQFVCGDFLKGFDPASQLILAKAMNAPAIFGAKR